MPINIKKILNPKSFSTLVGVAGTAIGIGIPFGIPLTIAICSLIYIYNTDSDRYNKIIKQFPDTIGEIIEIIRKGEGDAKDKIKEILHTIKKDKKLQHNIEKFSTADYGNKEAIQELLCTGTKNEAIRLYSQLINFNQENLKVLLSEISGLKEKQKEILNEFDRRFDDSNKNLERFKDEIIEDFRKTGLYKEGFEIITSDDYFSKYRPSKNCWDEGFRLIDVQQDYDVRREITDKVEKKILEEKEDVLVRGKSGFGKTILFYRIIVDFVNKDYLVLYKEDGDTLEDPKIVADAIKKYSYDNNVLVAIDNVHLVNKNIKAFYIVEDVERFENRDKIKFFFTAKEPEFDDLLNKDIKSGGGEPELKKKVNEIKEKMEECELKELTLEEIESFVRKYYDFEALAGKWILDKTILHEKIKKASSSYYGKSKGDPLLFTFYLTSEGRGLRSDVKYKIDRYVEYEMHVPIEMKKDFVLLTCFLESVNVQIKHEYLRGVLKLDKRTYNSILRELKEGVIYKDKDKIRTRHHRWALEYLKYIYERGKEESFEEELIEKVEDFTDALFDLHDETLAYNFVVGLSRLIVYNEDLRELFLPSLKVPESLSDDKKAELFTFYVGGFYYWVHEYDKAIHACTKAIKLNPELADAYLIRGGFYYDKREFDEAIKDFNKAIELGQNFEAGAYYNRGIAYIDKGEFDKAIEDFNKAMELDPEYATAYSGRGSAYVEKGELDRAVEDYNKAIGLNPKLAEAYNNRGFAYRNKGELDKAIEDYDTAIELKPNFAETYSNRGVAYTEKGELARAIEDCNKAIELKPKEANAYNNRGNAYADKGELDKAIEDFNKAIELNPELADAYYNRGLTYKNKGDFDKAIEDCNKAIELDPNFADAYNNRGLVYKEKGEFDKAIEDCNKAIELNPKLVEAYNNRGNAYAGKGEFDRAIEDYDKALELNPKLVKAYNNRGVAYKKKGELDRAIEDFSKAIESNPKLADAYIDRGNTYSDKGELDKAIEDFTKAIELRPDYANAYYNRGNTYLEKGEFDKAIQDYDKAVELMPDLALAYNNRANAYFEKGDYDKAIQDFTKVIELKPDSVKAYSGRGNAHACENELDKAIEDYNKAIELKPDHIEELYSIQMILYGFKGDIGKAAEKYNKAKEINPEVDVYGSNETFEKAIQNLRSIGSIGFEWFIKIQRAITELDAEAMEHYKRGYTYWIKQEFDNAIENFDKVIKRKPNFEMAYFIRGKIYLKKGEFDKAIENYNKAIELNPNDATAYHDRGLGYMEKGEYDKAVRDFNKAIDLNPKIAWLEYRNIGLVYVKKEEFDKAIEYFTKAIETKSDYAEAYYNRGVCYRQRNDWVNCANDFFISAFLSFLQRRGDVALKLFAATYDLKDTIDSPVCFECGVAASAFVEVIGYDPKYVEAHVKKIKEIQEHSEEISKSAKIVLDYLISGEVHEEIEVKDGRDAVFKLLLEGLQNRDKAG